MLTLPVQADCLIYSFQVSDDVRAIFRENNSEYYFKNFDVVCDKLNKNKARLVIDGQAVVIQNRSVAWVTIVVGDNEESGYLVVYSGGMRNIMTSTDANTSTSRELLWMAINEVLDNWTSLDVALAELNKARQSIRKSTAQR